MKPSIDPIPAAKYAVWDKRAKYVKDSIAEDTRVLHLKQFLADHFGYIGVNYFDSFSPVPDMSSLIFQENLTVISKHPIAPDGHFIGTWGGGEAMEISYKNSKDEPRFAYCITDTEVDDWHETALITSKALNHEQYLRLLWYVTARDTWHGEREGDSIPLPKLEEKIRQEIQQADHSAWAWFHTGSTFWSQQPGLLTAFVAADGDDTLTAIREALSERIMNQREYRVQEGFRQHFPTAEAELENSMDQVMKDWNIIRNIAAAIRSELANQTTVSP